MILQKLVCEQNNYGKRQHKSDQSGRQLPSGMLDPDMRRYRNQHGNAQPNASPSRCGGSPVPCDKRCRTNELHDTGNYAKLLRPSDGLEQLNLLLGPRDFAGALKGDPQQKPALNNNGEDMEKHYTCCTSRLWPLSQV